MHLHFEIYFQRFILDTNKLDMEIEEVSLENAAHKLWCFFKNDFTPICFKMFNKTLIYYLCIFLNEWFSDKTS